MRNIDHIRDPSVIRDMIHNNTRLSDHFEDKKQSLEKQLRETEVELKSLANERIVLSRQLKELTRRR